MSQMTTREVALLLRDLGRSRRAVGRAVLAKTAGRGLSTAREVESAKRYLEEARAGLARRAPGTAANGTQEVLR